MRVRTLFLLLVLVTVAAFVTLNWTAFMVPTELSLGVMVIHAPLGLVMLGLIVFLTALFLLFVIQLLMSGLLDTRRHGRELEASRKRADDAEVSKFSDLRGVLDAGLAKHVELTAEARAAVLARLDRLDHDLLATLKDSENSIAAHVGQLEDQLARKS